MHRRWVLISCGVLLCAAAVAAGQKMHPGLTLQRNAADSCPETLLLNFEVTHDGQLIREVPIWRLPESSAFFFEAGMAIDADGAPNAYNPADTGLDDLNNAGEPGHWLGLARDPKGNPYVQGPDDPFPGYYVSTTALSDRTKDVSDPSKYVDAAKIPYLVLPRGLARPAGARLGDFAVVFNRRNAKSAYAIFADVGPPEGIGEGSIALAENLGVWSDPRRGGTRRGIVYLIFPESGNGKPRPIEEINNEGEKLIQSWGGMQQLLACTAK